MNSKLPKNPQTPVSGKRESLGGEGPSALAPGCKAPGFDLADDASGRVSLASFAGKMLVLYFYPRDDTSGCTKQAIDFSALREEFENAGAAVLGVSADSPESHARFKAKHQLGLQLAADESKAMLKAYGVYAEKTMYGRKYMGIERTTVLIGKDGMVLAVWNKVKVPGHAAAVLEKVKAFQAA